VSEFKVGDKVTGIYKTGKYAGEITDIRPEHYLVRVLAVLKHPMQGDLHSPKDIEVGIFHERRALAFREQANIPKKMVKPFESDMPDYQTSLKDALAQFKEALQNDESQWAAQSIRNIETLEKDYFK
jgi:kinase-associated protein B